MKQQCEKNKVYIVTIVKIALKPKSDLKIMVVDE